MKSLHQLTLPLLTTGGILFTGLIGFQSTALAARIFVYHPNYSFSYFIGSTRDEALSMCRTWANRAKKDPNKCEVSAVYP
ncbi:hypothetical protein NIES2111_68100 (plasmid) [Nostoc sp. NIES-2111]|nr:hypothetical protein NIES2111_68100 [Nostoc sp. NIES-2111]